MEIYSDYHMHSSFSGDSKAPMEDMIRQAAASGLSRICFTEHMDMDYTDIRAGKPGIFMLDTDAYRTALLGHKERYAGRIKIGFGVELGLQPHIAKQNAAYVAMHDFDFVIASSHVCGGRDPYYPDFYEGRTQEDAYREYFASILENIQAFRDFDVYGHLDYIVRYGPERDLHYSYGKYADLIDPILTLLIANGKGIEINTGGAKHGLRELNPCTDIIKRYRKLGGEIITVGSDAHAPAQIAGSFSRAAAILKECGFGYYNTFQNRKPSFHKLA